MMIRATLVAATALASAIVASPAMSQDTTSATPPAQESSEQTGPADDLSVDIIVTAQKREQRLNNVGMSITAVSGAELTTRGINGPDDLAKISSGFVYTKSAYGVPVYTLRGVGFFDYSLGSVPAVTVYSDQIPFPYSTLSQFASLDVERVEVLKGPQGTLFGLNSTAGAVNYIAAKPTADLQAGASLTIGSYGAVDVRSFVSGPLSETLRARVATLIERGGGFQRSISRDDSLGDRRRAAVRLLLDWKPVDGFSAELNLNAGVDNSDTQALQFQQVNPLNPTNNTLRLLRPLLFNTPPSPQNARAADWQPGESLRNDNDTQQAALTMNIDLLSGLRLRSLTSYQHYNAASRFDGDGTTLQDFFGVIKGKMKAFYQELALYGEVGDRATYILGGNYESDSVDQGQVGIYPYSIIRVAGGGNTLNVSNQRARNWSLFGSGEVKLTDTLTLLGGARYSDGTRRFQGCTTAYDAEAAALATARLRVPVPVGGCTTIGPNGLPLQDIRSRLSQDNISWRAGVNFKPASDKLIYGLISRGYKSGSYPIVGASFYTQLNPVTQENVLSYEAGFKLGFNRVFQLNGAAYYYDYTDKQIRGRIVDPVLGALSTLVNVPKSRIWGAELQATLTPVTGLRLQAEGTYSNSKILGNYSNYDVLGFFQPLSGEALPFTPRFSGNLDVNYQFDLSTMRASVGGTVLHASATNAGLGERPEFVIPSYTTLDLRAGVRTADDRVGVSVFVRNVTDKYYWNSVVMILDAIGRYSAPPRTVGITFDVRM